MFLVGFFVWHFWYLVLFTALKNIIGTSKLVQAVVMQFLSHFLYRQLLHSGDC